MNFEPFFDFEAVTPEMAMRLHATLHAHRAAVEAFLEDQQPEVGKAALVLEAANECNQLLNDIMEALHTTPVMVHVAGPQREETNPGDPDMYGVLQRCTRCGSVLNFWTEHVAMMDPEHGPRMMEIDDVPWWSEGTRVAKAIGPVGMGMYSIPEDQDLAKHELPCVDLRSLDE